MKKWVIENRLLVIVLTLMLTAGFIYQLLYIKDMRANGVIVKGKIINCDMLKVSGACAVTIEFIDKEGNKRTSSNTLYTQGNCLLGKEVTIQYSNDSYRVDVLEDPKELNGQ